MGDLNQIIAIDTILVNKLQTSHTQIGDALKTIMHLAMHEPHVYDGGALSAVVAQYLGKKHTGPKFQTPYAELLRYDDAWCDQGKYEKTIRFNGQTLRVFVVNWGGSQKCPFQSDSDTSYHGYDYGASDVVVTNIETDQTLCYSSLLPHMIKHHHFFEGPFCFYRLEPASIMAVIGQLDPEKNYRLQSYKKMGWAHIESGSSRPVEPPAESLEIIQLKRHIVFVTKQNDNGVATELTIHLSDGDGDGDDTEKLKILDLMPTDLPKNGYTKYDRALVKHHKYDEWLHDQPPPPLPVFSDSDEDGPPQMGGGFTMIKFDADGKPIVSNEGCIIA